VISHGAKQIFSSWKKEEDNQLKNPYWDGGGVAKRHPRMKGLNIKEEGNLPPKGREERKG